MPGETPRQAAMRELKEEVGTDKAEILAESRGWLHYDLPAEIAGHRGAGATAASGRNGLRCALLARMAISTPPPPSIPNSTPGNGSCPSGCPS